MLEFFFFVLILCGAAWGSALVFALAKRLSERTQVGSPDMLMVALREEVEYLTARLGRLEEDLEFFKELKAPEVPGPPLLEENMDPPLS